MKETEIFSNKMNKLWRISIIVVIIFTILFLTSFILFTIYSSNKEISQDKECMKLGYLEFIDDRCIDEDDFINVWMICDYIDEAGLHPKCRVYLEDKK